MAKLLKEVFGTAVLLYFVLLSGMFIFQRHLMYFPQSPLAEDVIRSILHDGHVVQIKSKDSLLLNSYIVPPSGPKRPIILAFHENADVAPAMAIKFNSLMNEGYGVLFAEYRGYGDNPGSPTEDNLFMDASTYFEYLHGIYPQNPIVIYGQSLGAAVAIDIALNRKGDYGALILEAPFDSAVNVVAEKYPFFPLPETFMQDQYQSVEKIMHITAPKLFLIAGQDNVVGADSGMHLYKVADRNKTLVVFKDAAHTNIYNYDAENVVHDFLTKSVFSTEGKK